MTDIDVLIIEDDKDIQLGCVQALKLDNKRVIGVTINNIPLDIGTLSPKSHHQITLPSGILHDSI